VAFTLEGVNDRLLPETCLDSSAQSGLVPGQVALLAAGNKVLDHQIIFPGNNYGWLHIKKLPAGNYTLHAQISGDTIPKGLQDWTLTAYGLKDCAVIAGGTECDALLSGGPKGSPKSNETNKDHYNTSKQKTRQPSVNITKPPVNTSKPTNKTDK